MDPLTLLDGEHCLVSQARSFDLPGYLIVEMKRPHDSLISMAPAAREDQPPYSGARVVDWLWFHHGDLGHSRADVLAWVSSARASQRRADSWP